MYYLIFFVKLRHCLLTHVCTKTKLIKSLLKGPWTLSKLVAGRDIFRSHLYSHVSCPKKANYVEVVDDYLCQHNINTQQNIYTKVDQPGLKTRILAGIWMLVHNFPFTILSRPATFKGVCSHYKSNWFLLLLCIYTLFSQAIRWCKLFGIRQSNSFAPTNQIFPFTHG